MLRLLSNYSGTEGLLQDLQQKRRITRLWIRLFLVMIKCTDVIDGVCSPKYKKNASAAIQNQVDKPTQSGNVKYWMSTEVKTHPMKAKTGSFACWAAELHIQCSEKHDISSKTSDHHGEKSVVGAIQRNVKKPRTKIEGHSAQFHSVSVTLLHFTERRQRDHIMSSDTNRAYMTVLLNVMTSKWLALYLKNKKIKKFHDYVFFTTCFHA